MTDYSADGLPLVNYPDQNGDFMLSIVDETIGAIQRIEPNAYFILLVKPFEFGDVGDLKIVFLRRYRLNLLAIKMLKSLKFF